jgi:hypothetical protein
MAPHNKQDQLSTFSFLIRSTVILVALAEVGSRLAETRTVRVRAGGMDEARMGEEEAAPSLL